MVHEAQAQRHADHRGLQGRIILKAGAGRPCGQLSQRSPGGAQAVLGHVAHQGVQEAVAQGTVAVQPRGQHGFGNLPGLEVLLIQLLAQRPGGLLCPEQLVTQGPVFLVDEMLLPAVKHLLEGHFPHGGAAAVDPQGADAVVDAAGQEGADVLRGAVAADARLNPQTGGQRIPAHRDQGAVGEHLRAPRAQIDRVGIGHAAGQRPQNGLLQQVERGLGLLRRGGLRLRLRGGCGRENGLRLVRHDHGRLCGLRNVRGCYGLRGGTFRGGLFLPLELPVRPGLLQQGLQGFGVAQLPGGQDHPQCQHGQAQPAEDQPPGVAQVDGQAHHQIARAEEQQHHPQDVHLPQAVPAEDQQQSHRRQRSRGKHLHPAGQLHIVHADGDQNGQHEAAEAHPAQRVIGYVGGQAAMGQPAHHSTGGQVFHRGKLPSRYRYG